MYVAGKVVRGRRTLPCKYSVAGAEFKSEHSSNGLSFMSVWFNHPRI